MIRPYLIGNDLTDDPGQQPSRWVIDFGHQPLEEANRFGEALEIVRARVKPDRDKNPRATYRRNWWRFAEPLKEMRAAIAGLDRFIASPAQAKRIQFSFVDVDVCPSNLVTVFAFDDLYSLGVLASFAHDQWLRAGWSSLEDRLRYTPSTVFATFPWPEPTPAQRSAIADAAGAMLEVREELCTRHGVGLTTLYNTMDEGGYRDLAAAHRSLDHRVAAAYGWPKSHVSEVRTVLKALLERNLAITAGKLRYAGPG